MSILASETATLDTELDRLRTELTQLQQEAARRGLIVTPPHLPPEFSWRPQPKQTRFLEACGMLPFFEGARPREPICRFIGFGGAAGSSKTHGALGLLIAACYAFPGCSVGYFRRKFPELEGADGAIEQTRQMLLGVPGAKYNSTHHRWLFDNGSALFFCHCQYDANKRDYQSQQFDIINFDEATHFTWSIIDYLLTRNRATVEGPWAFAAFESNPGNIGHSWFRQLFIDSGNATEVNLATTPSGAIEPTWFLPATVEDNPKQLERDPDYIRKLESRDPDTVRALRWGDWDIAAGLFFARSWRAVARGEAEPHVIPDFAVPAHWPLYGSVDYGHHPRTPDEKPFVYGLYAQSEFGRIYRIDEVAAAHWDALRQIAAIKELEARYPGVVRYRVGCPSMFVSQQAGGPTIAAIYGAPGNDLAVTAPHTDRIGGWERCRLWLADGPDGRPMFQSFARCKHFNRQVPAVPVDEHRRDDIDRDAEDHAVEEWSHLLLTRSPPARTTLDDRPKTEEELEDEEARKREREPGLDSHRGSPYY